MATLRQKKLAKAIVDNINADKPLNKQQLVVSSGYSEITGDRHATEVLESKGVLEELEHYGFNEDSAKGVVGEILMAGVDDGHRLKAADMIFKVYSTYAPTKQVIGHFDANTPERIRDLADKLIRVHG